MRLRALTLVLALAACAPQEQIFTPAPPEQAKLEKHALLTADGAQLPYRSWLPKGKPEAVVLAVHGFNDYSRAFEGVGAFMKAKGVAVYAYDQRGFGDTAEKGIWAGEQNLLADVKQFTLALKKRHPKAPLFLLGESMGGAVVIAAAGAQDFPEVDGVILSAPAVWGSDGMNPFFRGTLWLMAHTMPYKRFSGSDLKVIASSNIDMLRKMAADPLIIKKTRVDAVYGVVNMMGSAYDDVPRLNMPTLVLYGAQDQVIPPSPIEETLVRFTQPVTYAYYPAGFHMLLRDLQASKVMADIYSWMQDAEEELPSGFGVAQETGQQVKLKRVPMKREFFKKN